MEPTININLRPCECRYRAPDQRPDDHPYPCAAAPVLLPCPLPDRPVEFTVTLGKCTCPTGDRLRNDMAHNVGCPETPIRVICTIGGDGTWAGSEVLTCDNAERRDGLFAGVDPEAAFSACRARWALVKALVLDTKTTARRIPNHWRVDTERLFTQRDAVFAALCDMARAEEAYAAAHGKAMVALCLQQPSDRRRGELRVLECYVEHVIGQVSTL